MIFVWADIPGACTNIADVMMILQLLRYDFNNFQGNCFVNGNSVDVHVAEIGWLNVERGTRSAYRTFEPYGLQSPLYIYFSHSEL